jgi:hypothetical protein
MQKSQPSGWLFSLVNPGGREERLAPLEVSMPAFVSIPSSLAAQGQEIRG